MSPLMRQVGGAALSLLTPSALGATITLDPVFGAHMVLQRRQPIQVSGQASPHQRLQLSLAGQNAATEADKDGRWQVEFSALEAGGPHTLQVQAGEEKIHLDDILVGELWVASGQSNMEWTLNQSTEGPAVLKHCDRPQLRLFNVTRSLKGLQGSWQGSGEKSAGEFSSLAWQFADGLQKALGVPVGIVNNAWSGTCGETWAPKNALPEVLKRWQARPAAEQRMYTEGWDFWLESRHLQVELADGKLLDLTPGEFSVDAANGAETRYEHGRYSGRLPVGSWAAAKAPLKLDLRGAKALRLQVKGNSHFDVALGQEGEADADRYCLPPFEATAQWQDLRLDLSELKQQGWGKPRAFEPVAVSKFLFRMHAPNQFPDQPGLLYDALLLPVAPLRPRGFLWYQGESNVARAGEYPTLLKALRQGLRDAWQAPQLAFVVVQLPDFSGPQTASDSWDGLRKAQASVMDDAHSALVVTLGTGGSEIHPRSKTEVAKRALKEVLGKFFGQR